MATYNLDPDVWAVWAQLHGKPKAKEYLRTVASGLYESRRSALAAIKTHDVTYWQWKKLPGFRALEDRLWTEPELASRFIASIYFPHALMYQADVLSGRESGSKAHAARFIIHIADPGLRPETPPKGAPEPPGFPQKSRINELLGQVEAKEKRDAEKEVD